MVAISLYRGNLHKLPGVTRRLPPPPTPKISPKTFKILLHRRNRALSRLRSSSTTNAATTLNPSPKPDRSNPDPVPADNNNDGGNNVDKEGLVKDDKLIEDKDGDPLRKLMERVDALVEKNGGEIVKMNDENKEVHREPEKSNTEDATSEVEKRRREVKERLEILGQKKHGLVQVLKQILNAEEQLKRQNGPRTYVRPRRPLQVDTTTDSRSMTRVNTPRLGSDGNPSSNMVPNSYRTTIGQSSVCVSGTSYIASSPSPSPAASGGTSVFRDAKLPTPWN